MVNLRGLIILFALILGPYLTKSQGFTVPDKVLSMTLNSIVYLESINKSMGLYDAHIDTVSGVGFLISDQGKTYLVTAYSNLRRKSLKGLIMQNDSIYLSRSLDGSKKGIYLKGLSKEITSGKHVFTSEKENLLILSLRKNHHDVIKYFLSMGSKPISLNLLQQVLQRQQPNDRLYHGVYLPFNDEKGNRRLRAGVGVNSVVSFSEKSNSFSAMGFNALGEDGAPVIVKGKVIGMIARSSETGQQGQVLKSTYVISALRQLQQKELSINVKSNY